MNQTQVEQVNSRLAAAVKELQQIHYEVQSDDDRSWRMLCAQILLMVQTESKRARDLVENMKSEGLTVGTIEAEGFLRAVRTIEEEVEAILEDRLDEIQFNSED